MITINLTFNSADEMFAFFGPRMAAVAAGAAPAVAPVGAPAPAPVADGPRRRGRPPKARPPVAQEINAVAPPVPVIPVPPAVEAAEPVDAEPDHKVWTEVEVREVMKTFNEKFGLDALRVAVVEATGKQKMSDVPQELYGRLVARLTAEIGAEKR